MVKKKEGKRPTARSYKKKEAVKQPSVSQFEEAQASDSQSVIETGIDRLIRLVKQEKKISFSNASKQLNVPRNIITEWANFLEEEGVAKIYYIFTSPYLELKQLPSDEIAKREEEIAQSKNNVEQKVESTINVLNTHSDSVDQLRTELDSLKNMMTGDFDDLKSKLSSIKSTEAMKKDAQLAHKAGNLELKEQVQGMNSALDELGKKYQDLSSEIKKQQEELEKEKGMEKSVEEMEEDLRKKLNGFQSVISKLEKNPDKQNEVDTLKNLSAKITQAIEQRKQEIQKSADEIKKHEQKINSLKGELNSYSLKSKLMFWKKPSKNQDAHKAKIVEKKNQADKILQKAQKEMNELKTELDAIIKKSAILQTLSNSKSSKKSVKEIQAMISKLERNYSIFHKSIQMLEKTIEAL